MKRRHFIRLVGASAAGLPFLFTQLGSASWKGKPSSRARSPLNLSLSSKENRVLTVLTRNSKGAYLLGGGVLAKVADGDLELPYLNVLVESQIFNTIKDDLFRLGVTPISTPELPSTFIRFVYHGQAYSVMNMELERYLEQNTLGKTLRLLPLAHNFLVYSIKDSWVLDPYEALPAPGASKSGVKMKLAHQPESTMMAAEVCLAIAFDSALLNLQPPAGHSSFEKGVLNSSVKEEGETVAIVHHLLNYFPDLLELRGLPFARKYLLSPLYVAAAASGPGISLHHVDASLSALTRGGKEVTSAHLVSAINNQFCRTGKVSVFGTGIPDYMAVKKMPARRTDLLAQALSETETVEG